MPSKSKSLKAAPIRKCHYCGCTESAACPGGCVWIDKRVAGVDLCSACVWQLFDPKVADSLPPSGGVEALGELHRYIAAEFEGHALPAIGNNPNRRGLLKDKRAIESIRCLFKVIKYITD